MAPDQIRTTILTLAAVACFAFAFYESNPAWIASGGALLGGEALVHARPGGATQDEEG